MHKKFLRISVLALGAAFCILPTLREDVVAMKVINATGSEKEVGLYAYMKYRVGDKVQNYNLISPDTDYMIAPKGSRSEVITADDVTRALDDIKIRTVSSS